MCECVCAHTERTARPYLGRNTGRFCALCLWVSRGLNCENKSKSDKEKERVKTPWVLRENEISLSEFSWPPKRDAFNGPILWSS